MKNYLEKAIKIIGSQEQVAQVCHVKQQHVSHWLNKSNGKVPAEHVLDIEKATQGQVTRYELRPDVFGDRVA